MAAATAAALGSRLGVVGTIAGAACAQCRLRHRGQPLHELHGPRRRTRSCSCAHAGAPTAPTAPTASRWRWCARRWWRRPDRTDDAPGPRHDRVPSSPIAAAFLTGLQLATGAQVTGTDLGGRTSAGAWSTPLPLRVRTRLSRTPSAPRDRAPPARRRARPARPPRPDRPLGQVPAPDRARVGRGRHPDRHRDARPGDFRALGRREHGDRSPRQLHARRARPRPLPEAHGIRHTAYGIRHRRPSARWLRRRSA